VNDAFATARFAPRKRINTTATKAKGFEGSELLGQLPAGYMDQHYHDFGNDMHEFIVEHNSDPKNFKKLSNCQHWVTDMVELLVDARKIPDDAKTAVDNAPK
jgi:hypothetical protein